ncbi:hypothetical protein ACJRO7_025706 [Eucalyptus globulus]|uniref:TIR domain-containing protein n=1 Tax=Eucalyptus globulus TaxID=34317 RepID=A0ABD3KBU9_EUCGL
MKRKWDSPGPSTASASVDDGDSSSGAEFEVFLSFKGLDTRKNFTDSLYQALHTAGVRVFKDDKDIRQGEKIGDKLLHAIKSSKIYVPIFSKNYAFSRWCLRELAHMVNFWSKAKDKIILPIFFNVDPEDVKLETNLYLDALGEHEEKFGHEVPQWKKALTKVAEIRGLDLKNKGHGEIINDTMDEVMTKLMKRRIILPDHLVEIHDQVEAIMDLLNKGSRDTRYLVIHGMGGIGKTTLVSAIFNRISSQFEGYSFLRDVCENMRHGRTIDLQKQLLSDILQGRCPEIYNSTDVGINIIRERFRNKKVLVVIDDVDKWNQLSALAGKSDWFGLGSKIIITTRDINFLPIKEEEEEEEEEGSFQAHSKEFEIYEMKEMDYSYALKLFSLHALGMDFPPPHCEDISHEITYKTGGLPLALEVIGSSLFGKNKKIWKETSKKLMPKQEVFDRLNISYDMLDDAQREIFLDIACYFIGIKRLHPYYMWKASGHSPNSNLLILTRMSLIKIEEYDRLWMHDQLRDFGRKIIQREDKDPGKHSRLWMPDIALNVVQRKLASNKIVALNLAGDSKVHNFTRKEFLKLPNLRFLKLNGGNLVGNFKNLLSQLTWLSWSNCPSKLKANNLCLEKLVVLKLSAGDSGDWVGWEQCMVSSNLKVIHINSDGNSHRTLDFSKCENLKKFIVQNCSTTLLFDGSFSKLEHLEHLQIEGAFEKSDECNLSMIASSLGGLSSLSMLYIERIDIEEIHHSIGELKHLKHLSLIRCSLEKLPDSIGKLTSLLELNLRVNKFTELPNSIGDLKKLMVLSLDENPIEKLPDSIGGLESLIELCLIFTGITELPASIGNLKRLKILCIKESKIRELPETIETFVNLEELDASDCENLEGGIPNGVGVLSFLRILDLSKSKIRRLPTSMNQLSHFHRLSVAQCDELEQIPELPTSLKELDFPSHLLWTAIDLSHLTNLVTLHIGKGTPQLSEFGDGAPNMAPNIEWIKGLLKLESFTLYMEDAAFSLDNLATLSRLQRLEITCIDPRSLIALPSSLNTLYLHHFKSPDVKFADVLGQQLEKLHNLEVGYSKLLERLSGFSSLKELRYLVVYFCPRLTEIQGVEKLESLEHILICGCESLQTLSGLSELKKLLLLELYRSPLLDLPDSPPQTRVVDHRHS